MSYVRQLLHSAAAQGNRLTRSYYLRFQYTCNSVLHRRAIINKVVHSLQSTDICTRPTWYHLIEISFAIFNLSNHSFSTSCFMCNVFLFECSSLTWGVTVQNVCHNSLKRIEISPKQIEVPEFQLETSGIHFYLWL